MTIDNSLAHIEVWNSGKYKKQKQADDQKRDIANATDFEPLTSYFTFNT